MYISLSDGGRGGDIKWQVSLNVTCCGKMRGVEYNMDKKYIKIYWKEVIRQAWASAWDRSGMKILIPIIAIVFGASVLGGFLFMFGLVEYPFFRDNLAANFLTGLSQVLFTVVALVYLFIYSLSQIPPKIHKEKEDEIEAQKKTIADFEERLSNNKITIVDYRAQKELSGKVLELRHLIKNDSGFSMTEYYALIETVRYAISKTTEPKEVPDFPRNTFHLVFPGEGGMAYHLEPISAGDVAWISIARLSNQKNFFKFEVRESDSNKIFEKSGIYTVTIKIAGILNGIGVTKRISTTIEYKSGKKFDVISCVEFPE